MTNLTLDAETARSIAYEYTDPEQFVVIKVESLDQTRWGIIKRVIFLNMGDSRHYALEWEEGATESQDYDDFENGGEFEAYEVKPVEVTVIEWQKV